jgi:hypothetical protein
VNLYELAPEEARKWSPLAILSYPLVAILYVLNFARIFWADLGYGIEMPSASWGRLPSSALWFDAEVRKKR